MALDLQSQFFTAEMAIALPPRKKKRGPKPALELFCCVEPAAQFMAHSDDITIYTVYVLDAVVPPRPVQLVWKNWPRGWSTRS
jgi:hypothetical protein